MGELRTIRKIFLIFCFFFITLYTSQIKCQNASKNYNSFRLLDDSSDLEADKKKICEEAKKLPGYRHLALIQKFNEDYLTPLSFRTYEAFISEDKGATVKSITSY
jgi:hypothetical protein